MYKDVADAVRGKKGAPNMWDVPEDVHKAIHEGSGGGKYNARFKEELRKLEALGRPVTKADVLRIRDDLVKEFDLEGYRPGGQQ